MSSQWVPLHIPSRLKGIETFSSCCARRSATGSALHIPSRLKGIETRKPVPVRINHQLCIYLPVWRELKPSQLRVMIDQFETLCIYLPVWRELKRFRPTSTRASLIFFAYTFPFEGNWNIGTPLPKNGEVALHIPSRLKGIETILESSRNTSLVRLCIYLPVWRELKLFKAFSASSDDPSYFAYTFPFEGNWNSYQAKKKPESFSPEPSTN